MIIRYYHLHIDGEIDCHSEQAASPEVALAKFSKKMKRNFYLSNEQTGIGFHLLKEFEKEHGDTRPLRRPVRSFPVGEREGDAR